MRLPTRVKAGAPQCPHLGSADDPFSRASRATDEHRCYAQLGRERVDLAHQRRFCLTSAHAQCPFLMVSGRRQRRDWLAEARAGRRVVSLVRPALASALAGAWRIALMVGRGVVRLANLLIQTWRTARVAPVVVEESVTPVVEVESVTPVVEVESVTSVMKVESVTPVMEVESVTSVMKVESLTPVVEVESVTPVMEVEYVTQVPEEEVVRDPHLVERGIAALERGLELEAYAAFRLATEQDPLAARAWFWRAKTSQTLDEVIDCLKHGASLEPDNALVASSLEWAVQRREAARAVPIVRKSERRESVARGPTFSHRLARASGTTLRIAGGMVVIGVAVAWLVSALPDGIGIPLIPVPTWPVHVPVGGGYDAASALTYGLGFMALFMGIRMLNRTT